MGWFPWAVMSLTSNSWSRKDANLTKRLNKQGPKRRKAIIAFKWFRKERNWDSFTVDQTKEATSPLPKLWLHSAWSYISLVLTFTFLVALIQVAAGSISYHTNSTLFCQEVLRSQTIIKNCISQGNERSQVPLILQIGANPLQHFTYLLMVSVFEIGISDILLDHRYVVLLLWPVRYLEVKALVWTSVPN